MAVPSPLGGLLANVKVYFYYVNGCLKNGKDFPLGRVLHDLADIKVADRGCALDSVPFRAQEIASTKSQVWGDMVRVRMSDLDEKTHLRTGDSGPLDFTDEEGLGVRTAFMYDRPSRVLLLQERQSGAKQHTFERYISQISRDLWGESVVLDLVPIKNQKTKELFKRAIRVSSMRIKISLDATGKPTAGDNFLRDVIRKSRRASADTIDVVIKSKRGKSHSIDLERAHSIADEAIGYPGVQRVDVRAASRVKKKGDEYQETGVKLLKLLGGVLFYEERVESEFRTVDYIDRKGVVRKAWEDWGEVMRMTYPMKGHAPDPLIRPQRKR